MPGNRPSSRPAAGGVLLARRVPLAALAVLALILIIPSVSAETIIDETFTIDIDTSYTHSFPKSSTVYNALDVTKIRFWHIEDYTQMYYVDIVGYPNTGSWPTNAFLAEGRYETTYTLGGQTKSAVIYATNKRDILGEITSTKYTIFFADWDIGQLVGAQDVTLGTRLFHSGSTSAATSTSDTVQLYGADAAHTGVLAKYDLHVTSALKWQNHLDVFLNDDKAYEISLTRNLLRTSPSTITGYQDESVVFTNLDSTDFTTVMGQSQLNTINVSSATQVFSRSLVAGGTPTSSTATIYVRSSATGAFVSNALVNATHLETGESQEKLLPSGSGTFSLIPSTGEVANYEFNVTAPGYHDHILRLLVSGDMSIPVNLMPIGDELPENETTLKFTIHQSTGGWLSGATVQLNDGRSGLTNAAGYCEFVVEKNTTISYSVKKTGFYPLSGSVVMGIYERVVLHSLIPTDVPLPTPTEPGETPGPTPTATPGSVTSHREAMRNTMEQQYGVMPTYVSLAFFLLFLAILKRGMR